MPKVPHNFDGIREDEEGNAYIPSPEDENFSPAYIRFNGETKTVSEWSKEIGLSNQAIQQRIVKGWSIKKALTTPNQNKVKYLKDFDPETPDYLVKLITNLTRDSVERLVTNKDTFHKWIDEQTQTDPMKVINALDKLISNTAKLIQQSENRRGANDNPATVKIEFNSTVVERNPKVIEVNDSIAYLTDDKD